MTAAGDARTEAPLACPCCGHAVDPDRLVIDIERRIVLYGGKKADLTGQQFAIFGLLAALPGRLVPRKEISAALAAPERHPDGHDRKSIDVHICHMRKALDPLGLFIVSQWGTGYYLAMAGADDAATFRAARRNVGRRPRRQSTPDTEMVGADGLPPDIVAEASFTLRSIADDMAALDRRITAAAARSAA